MFVYNVYILVSLSSIEDFLYFLNKDLFYVHLSIIDRPTSIKSITREISNRINMHKFIERVYKRISSSCRVCSSSTIYSEISIVLVSHSILEF